MHSKIVAANCRCHKHPIGAYLSVVVVAAAVVAVAGVLAAFPVGVADDVSVAITIQTLRTKHYCCGRLLQNEVPNFSAQTTTRTSTAAAKTTTTTTSAAAATIPNFANLLGLRTDAADMKNNFRHRTKSFERCFLLARKTRQCLINQILQHCYYLIHAL